jgi:tetratricopeptide (TPR) repeat protein
MARILLVERRIADAGHYLTFAREEAREDRATDLIARSLEAARLFLVGNLSRAAGQFTELVEPLLRMGFSEWLIFAWFALGRVSFELGDYRRAASQFAMTADWAAACGMSEPARTIQAWRRRARVLAEDGTRFEAAQEWGDELRAEERLFVAEGLIRDGAFAEALVELEAAEQQEAAVDRWPRLGVCWDNGFAPLEDLVMANRGGNSELLRIIRAFRGWTLAHLDRQDEAATVFYGLTRGNDGRTVDPYTGLYTYLYSSILPRERSRDREDRLTVLSKSVKLLQERTSRIDDYRDKTRFLRYNVWNRRLMDVAREHNLV